eukprot:m.102262 g.102262  ORF g.102262 m.102262 type:complete len:407 (-) comp13765_c0_seq5:1284-2504(-)
MTSSKQLPTLDALDALFDACDFSVNACQPMKWKRVGLCEDSKLDRDSRRGRYTSIFQRDHVPLRDLKTIDWEWYGIAPADTNDTVVSDNSSYKSWSSWAKQQMELESNFEGLQEAFRKSYNTAITSLMGSRQQDECKVKKINVGAEPVKRFMNARRKLNHQPILVFHGTDPQNLASIYKRGLLIPGSQRGRDIRVANGSAHGVGIYTAETPYISQSYAGQGRKLIACALLDKTRSEFSSKSKEKKNDYHSGTDGQSQALKNKIVRKQNTIYLQRLKGSKRNHGNQDSTSLLQERHAGHLDAIKHYGDVKVIFNEALVVPMYEVSYENHSSQGYYTSYNSSQSSNKRNKPQIPENINRTSSGSASAIGLGNTSMYNKATKLQRSIQKRNRDKLRKLERNSKNCPVYF